MTIKIGKQLLTPEQKHWNEIALGTDWMPVFVRSKDEQDAYETSDYAGLWGYKRDSPWHPNNRNKKQFGDIVI